MPKALTPIAVANLKPRSKRYEVSDGGCVGLRLVIFPSGRRSFVLRFRFRGLQRKLTLGAALVGRGTGETDAKPELGTPLSLAAARELATKALREAKSGRDPCAAKQQARQQELAAESDTLAAIAAEYLRRAASKLRTVGQRRADLDLLCNSVLGRLPLNQISRAQFTRVFDAIADERGPGRADRVLSATKTLMAWHAGRTDYVPVLGRGGRRISPKDRARERVLDDSELRRVVAAAERDDSPFGRYLLFTLLTATRRGESAGLRRSELSDDGNWCIPGHRYKNGKDVVIPLSGAAQRIVASMPVLAGGDFVFSADGSHPLGGWDDRKKAFDKVCGITENWRIHDLRRSARTLLSRAGISADTAERCLGHAITGVRGVYDRFAYLPEKTTAFAALAELVERIVHPPTDVVVPMKKGARK